MFGEVEFSLTSKIVVIIYDKNWKDVKITHGDNCPAEFISSSFNNYLTSYLPLFVLTRGKGTKLNARRNRPSYTAISRFLKRSTEVITSMIGKFSNNTVGAILMIYTGDRQHIPVR